MTEEEKKKIRELMENEEAEWAMRECIKGYRQMYMPLAMKVRGFYDAAMNVGFDVEKSMILAVNFLDTIMRCDESGSHTGL